MGQINEIVIHLISHFLTLGPGAHLACSFIHHNLEKADSPEERRILPKESQCLLRAMLNLM